MRFFIPFLVISVLLGAVLMAPGMASTGSPAPAGLPASTGTPSPTPSPTSTRCPSATPEPLWVEPVTSPTDLLTQTITVRIGNGEAVTVTAESGVFTTTGTFNAYALPALVSIDLLPATTHHLQVQARVRAVSQWGCQYGGYTLNTSRDRLDQPLTIEQVAAAATSRPRLYLPLILH